MTERNPDVDSANMAYLESLIAELERNPSALGDLWSRFLNGDGASNGRPATGRPRPAEPAALEPTSPPGYAGAVALQDSVDQLIRAYRVRGHLAAHLDPLGLQRPKPRELAVGTYGLSESDWGRQFSTKWIGGPQTQSLRDIVNRLQETYCRFIGVQFMHIDEPEVRDWLAERMEASQNRLALSREEQLRILTRLTDAVIFEEFVRKKFVGAKTFSLEGAESLIPLLDLAIEKSAHQGVDEIVIAMAHRGRLNVLANIVGKSPQEIFWEFVDPMPERHMGSGDVKYHMGFSGDWRTARGRLVHLSMCFNPSHLEFVNPVAVGRMRAKQDRAEDTERRRGMVLLIHGDAAFAGEGITQETLNLSGVPGYHVGGTLHVIVNNQLGFTTSPAEGRSTTYASDVAKMLRVPIFHVNGEHPEAVAQAVALALDFRARFQRDVVIDMYCYRRWGHNEGDEPGFTQPLLYRAIEQRKPVRDGYLEHLLTLNGVTREEADAIAEQRHDHLEREFKKAKRPNFVPRPQSLSGVWEGYRGGPEPDGDEPETAVREEKLQELLRKLTEVPEGFHVHPKLKASMERRRRMADLSQPIDWSSSESLAIATLAIEGHRVRITGQDAARGTFSQRHAVLRDIENGNSHSIFKNLTNDQAPVEILNSPLCEAGDIGFQYGYSLDYPEALVAWEAQYGDFVNCGQVIIDQFVASAEDKWRRLSGLVFLLPHGFEGQGPEHSSAQLERWLSLTAEHNIQVVYPSTPAQYFHLLRKQVKRRWRKPLVIFTPKSLLRHSKFVSQLDELSSGSFRRVIPEEGAGPFRRILLCSGKIYYELLAYREEHQRSDVALIRVEQFYPLPEPQLRTAFAGFPPDMPVTWVQEEPQNLGGWFYWKRHYGNQFLGQFPFSVVARPESASPATGSSAAHRIEQKELIERAFRATT